MKDGLKRSQKWKEMDSEMNSQFDGHGKPDNSIDRYSNNSVAVGKAPWDYLLSSDSEIAGFILDELRRQRTTVQLIASENFVSPAVLAASASVLTNKYAEGYPQRRYYGGNKYIDEIETLAIERLKKLFAAEHANVQPHSGASANVAVYQALLNPGDTILAMSLDQGGHLTHGSKASITGKMYNFVHYGVGEDEKIDLEGLQKLASVEKPNLIVAGTTAYSRIIDPVPFKEIADSVGALFMFDAAHPMGLIASKVHPSPVGVADIVTFTTHKTLRGPRGGAILCKDKFAKAIDQAVFPGLQGGPLEHTIAAKAVAFKEASDPRFVTYSKNILENAKALASAIESEGFRLVSGGTENHQVLVDLRLFDPELTGKKAQETLDLVGLTCNRNQIPNDPRSPFITSGLRLGTPAETTAGMGPNEMKVVASLIAKTLRAKESELANIKEEVLSLTKNFDPYPEHGDWPGFKN